MKGNMSSSLLNKLVTRELSYDSPKIKFAKYKIHNVCARGKYTRSLFKQKKYISTTRPLEMLHMDLCRPVKFKAEKERNTFY